MKSAFAILLLASLAAGCDDDPNTPGVQIICPTPAPQLAGTWTGTLHDRPLTVALTEECVAWLFGERSWWIEGEWSWSGMQGLAIAGTTPTGPQISLRLGAPPQPTSFVMLTFVAPVPVPAGNVTGFARGTWRMPTDTTRMVASFDSVPVTMQKR